MTDVQICNLALARLGDARITSLSDSTAQATYCSLFYAQTVEELQADFDWSFCRKQTNLTSGTAPLTGYSLKYTLPTDFIRALRLGTIDASENFGTWEVVGTELHTNLPSPVALDYIANITTTTQFPAIFVEALSIKLAAVLAMPLTGSKDLFGQMAELFAATIQKPAFLKATEAYAPARSASPTISQNEICRQAILRVGSADLFKPHGEPMVIAQSFYETVRDSLLADFQWSFARAQVSVAKDAVAPAAGSGYINRYPLPANTKQILRVNNIDDSENLGKWEIVGSFIHTDLPTPIIVDYISEVTDATKYPPIFIELLTATLALKLATLVELPR